MLQQNHSHSKDTSKSVLQEILKRVVIAFDYMMLLLFSDLGANVCIFKCPEPVLRF